MSDYWKRRAEEAMDIVQAGADRSLDVIAAAMQKSLNDLTKDVNRIMGNYQQRYGLTKAEAEAYLRNPVSIPEYKLLVEKIKGMPDSDEKWQLEAMASTAPYGFRVSRAEAIRNTIAIEAEKIAQTVGGETGKQLDFAAKEAYSRSMFSIQKQTGAGFHALDSEKLQKALNARWDIGNYSKDIWAKHRDSFTDDLQKTIVSGVMSQRSQHQIIMDIKRRYSVTFRQAERLVRTETSFISNQADLQSYKDAGIENYIFLATLDSATCSVCGALDGDSIPVAEAEVGVNLPPLHPNDRCTTIADVETGGKTRAAEGKDGKNTKVPKDMKYEEWKKWQEAGAPEDVEGWRGENRGNSLKIAPGSGIIAERKELPEQLQREPMPLERFERIKRSFEKKGGMFWMDDEAQKYLDSRGAEAISLDEETIAFRKNPTSAAVFEELIHTTQRKSGLLQSDPISMAKCEILAKEKLLLYAKAYGLTEAEIQDTIRLLAQDKALLKKLLEGRR